MFKKLVICFFAAILLSIFPGISEAAKYTRTSFEITFPDQCNNIFDFTNGITARNNNYSITVWLPTPLDSEQLNICNGKTELAQLTPDELRLLADHLATIRKDFYTTILRTTLINVPPFNAPAVYYLVERDDNSRVKVLEVNIISRGRLYSLTFMAKPDSFDEYEKTIFNPAIASFKI